MVAFALTWAIVVALVGVVYFQSSTLANLNSVSGAIGVDFETSSVHARITMTRNGEKFFDQYHSGVVTDIGDNVTLAKLFGDSDFNVTAYSYNCTFISIGNQGSLSSSSTVLPGEWNRTSATVQHEAQSQLNITSTFYPDAGGPYTADCIGINWQGGIGMDTVLWGYDTFSEVTGIDETFTITVEFQVSVSHA